MDPINKVFEYGMKRLVPSFDDMEKDGLILEIGQASWPVPNAIALNLPDYDADVDVIPYGDNTINQIHCYHVLEHLKNPLFFLSECSRVLKVGKTINIVMPHYLGSMAFHDFTHKQYYAVDVFKTLLGNPYYDSKYNRSINFEIVGAMIMGLVERNLAIIAQLRKI